MCIIVYLANPPCQALWDLLSWSKMPRPTNIKHSWGSSGHNIPPDNTLSPELIDLIYAPKDITTDQEWMLQNAPHFSVLEMGEGRLMLGIFINAIACLKTEKYVAEVWNWIMDYEANGLHSFNSVCWHLKWDPGYIRKLTVESFGDKKPKVIPVNRVYYKRD